MRKTNKHISIPLNEKLAQILRLYMPFYIKAQYFKEGNYDDKEMFYSMNDKEKSIIAKRL